MNKMNKLIMISIDTLRADVMFNREAFYAKYNIKNKLNTPNLDWLMSKSSLLENCITTSPYTTASHASYFTGYWPKNHSVKDFFKNKLTKKTIYQLLHERGYSTFFCTDFPFILGKYLGFQEGIDHYYVENEHKALEEFKQVKNNKFAFFHFADVHWPYGYHILKDEKDRSLLMNFVSNQAEKNNIPLSTKVSAGTIEAVREKQDLLLEQNYRRIIDYYCEKEDYNTLMQWYTDGITRFDNGRFSKFIKHLKQSGVFEDPQTLIVIFSDHGENWSNESYGHFNSCDYDVIHVPVLIYNKNMKRQAINKLARSIDIVPTILDLFETKKIKENFDGVNIFRKSPKYAIAQSYVSDFKELIQFFEKTNASDSFMDGRIRSFLLKEAVTSGNKKLEVKYTNNGDIEYRKSSIIKGGLEITSTKSYQKSLLKILKIYNKGVLSKMTKVSIDKKILTEFKNLGYFGGKDE